MGYVVGADGDAMTDRLCHEKKTADDIRMSLANKGKNMSLPVILDTDIGNDPDDLLALAMILDRSDLFDLRAVVTTGKAPAQRAGMVRHLCLLCNRQELPIGIGSATENSKAPTEFHVSYFAKAGADIACDQRFPVASDILDDHLTPDVNLITIGPLTTLADTLRMRPTMSRKLGRLVSMGGFISRKKKKPVREYNFGTDQAATRVVLEYGCEHLCVTKNVCGGIRMLPEQIASATLRNSPARQCAFAFMKEWFGDREVKTLHDPFTAGVAL